MNGPALAHDASARVAYGLDVSGRLACLVRVKRTRRGVQAERVLQATLPDEESLLQTALTSVQAEALAGDAVDSAAMPALSIFTRWLQTPFPSATKARKVAPSLLDIQLPVPLEQCVWSLAGEERDEAGQVRLLAAAARLSDVQERIARIRSLGLDPMVLDHEGLALWREAGRLLPIENDRPRVVFHLGAGYGLLLIGTGAGLQAVHGLRSEPAPDEAGATAWAMRVRQALRAHALGDRGEIDGIWTGPGAEIESMRQRLEAALGDLPVAFRTAPEPADFLARALAVRRLLAGAYPCSFRYGAAAHPLNEQRAARRQRKALLVMAAAAVALCLLNAGWLHLLDQRSQRMQDQLTRTAREVSGLPVVPRGQEEFAVQQALASGAGQHPAQGFFAPSLTGPLRALTRTARQEGITLQELELELDRFTLTGLASDADRAQRFVNALQDAGYQVAPEIRIDGAQTRMTLFGRQP